MFTCSVYSVWQPSPKDRSFLYSGDIHDLKANTLERLCEEFKEIVPIHPGTIKPSTLVYENDRHIGYVDSYGFHPDERQLQAVALETAQRLGIESETVELIRRGNLHEITFFANPGVRVWLTKAPDEPRRPVKIKKEAAVIDGQLSLFDMLQ